MRYDEATVTPRGRANALYYSGLCACAAGALVFVIGQELSSTVLSAVGVLLIACFVVLAVIGLATSRCPHCHRYIDLRGVSGYCVRCGRWIPAREEESTGPV
jgi:hypothetical protein